MSNSNIEAHQAARAARIEAVSRIERSMEPGAQAMGRSHPVGKYCHETERDLSGQAPFTSRTVLCWRSTVHNADMVSRGATPDRRCRAQVIAQDNITPLQLRELARLAILFTEEVRLEADAEAAAACGASASEERAFTSILPFLRGDDVIIIGAHERAGERGRIREVTGDGALVCGLGDDIDGPAPARYIALVNLEREE